MLKIDIFENLRNEPYTVKLDLDVSLIEINFD